MHPILVKAGPVTIYSYGFCVSLAMLFSWIWIRFLARRSSYSPSAAADLVFVALAAGVVGARFFYVLQHWGDYSGRLVQIFFLQEGGLVWYGGFLGACIAVTVVVIRRGESALEWADLFSPVLPMGHAVGRVGCFLNGCCFGKDGRPVQVYEAFALLFLSAFLHILFFRRRRAGEVFGFYLLGYGIVRFILEFYRGDQYLHAALTIPQWISTALMATGAWLLFLRKKNAA